MSSKYESHNLSCQQRRSGLRMNQNEGGRQFLYNTFSYQAAPKYHGLENQGATCYLNSVLQVLFMTEDFREAVERYAGENPDTQLIDHHLHCLFSDLQKCSADTYNITRTLDIDKVYEQRDAAECFERIIRLTSGGASQIFHGLLSHKTTCCKCGEETDRDEACWHLPLALVDSCSDSYSVVDGIREFFTASVFSGEDQMYCDQCDAKVDATTQYVMKRHPDILILLLKRFQFSYHHMSYVKINSLVDVPSTIQIPERQMYQLYAFVDHSGDLRGGHYTATIKDEGEDKWYNFNDTRVTLSGYQPFQVDNNERSRTAYLLFYRKKKEEKAVIQHNMSTNGGVTLATTENHDQCEDAEKSRKRSEGGDDVEMGEDTAVPVSVSENEVTGIEDIVRDVSRGAGLSEEPGNEVNVRQTGAHKNQEDNEDRKDDYLQDASVNMQEREEGKQIGNDEEAMRGKAEADDQTENTRSLSVETTHDESIKYNENVEADADRERMLDANFKQDKMSDVWSRVMVAQTGRDERTEDKQTEKPLMEHFNRDAEHPSEGGLDSENRNEDQDSTLKTGQHFNLGHMNKQEDEEMKTDVKGNTERKTGANELPSVRAKLLTRYDLLKGTKDQHTAGDDVKEKMSGSDWDCKQGSSSRLDKKPEQQRKEERREVKGNNEQKRRDQEHSWKEKQYERNETPDNGRRSHAQQNIRKKDFVECVGVEEKGDEEIITYKLKDRKGSGKDGRVGDSTRSKPFDDQQCKREISQTSGRHVEDKKGENIDTERDGEQDQRRGSARQCSEGRKGKDSRDDESRQKNVKKQAKEKGGKEDKFHNREDCGQVGTVRGLRESQERISGQMSVDNKGQDDRPDKTSEEDTGPAKSNKHKRTSSNIFSYFKIKKTRTEAAEGNSNRSHHDQNTDGLTRSISSLMLTELPVPESKKRKTWKPKMKVHKKHGKEKEKKTKEKKKKKKKEKIQKHSSPGCFSMLRKSLKTTQQSAEED